MRVWILFLVLTCSACAHVEYLYRHDVRGVVVDNTGQAVAGARVFRGESADATEVYGLPSLYEVIADENGRFAFEYSGNGGEPEPLDVWHVIAVAADGRRGSTTVEVPWQVEANGLPVGYRIHDVRVQLP